MKNKRINIHLFVLLLMVVAGCGTSNVKLQVLFEQRPDIMGNQLVYYKDYQIGKASTPKLMKDGQYFTMIFLIKSDYQKLLHSNSTFYIEDGRINLYHLKEEEGDLLHTGTTLKGFNSKIDLLLFQTQKIGEKSANDFLEWANKSLEELTK